MVTHLSHALYSDTLTTMQILRRNKSEITGRKVFSPLSSIKDNATVAMRGIHNSVLVAVVVHCRAGMGLRLHHWMARLGLIFMEEFPGNWPYSQRRDKPREQILSDLSTIAPFRAMPCVHPPV